MARWHFKQHDGYGDINQSSSAEAFEGSAVKGLTTSVVRESVQNVLDVPLNRIEPTRVRFKLIETTPSGKACSDWFDGLMHHLQQPGAGTPSRRNPASPAVICSSRTSIRRGSSATTPPRCPRHGKQLCQLPLPRRIDWKGREEAGQSRRRKDRSSDCQSGPDDLCVHDPCRRSGRSAVARG